MSPLDQYSRDQATRDIARRTFTVQRLQWVISLMKDEKVGRMTKRSLPRLLLWIESLVESDMRDLVLAAITAGDQISVKYLRDLGYHSLTLGRLDIVKAAIDAAAEAGHKLPISIGYGQLITNEAVEFIVDNWSKLDVLPQIESLSFQWPELSIDAFARLANVVITPDLIASMPTTHRLFSTTTEAFYAMSAVGGLIVEGLFVGPYCPASARAVFVAAALLVMLRDLNPAQIEMLNERGFDFFDRLLEPGRDCEDGIRFVRRITDALARYYEGVENPLLPLPPFRSAVLLPDGA